MGGLEQKDVDLGKSMWSRESWSSEERITQQIPKKRQRIKVEKVAFSFLKPDCILLLHSLRKPYIQNVMFFFFLLMPEQVSF